MQLKKGYKVDGLVARIDSIQLFPWVAFTFCVNRVHIFRQNKLKKVCHC